MDDAAAWLDQLPPDLGAQRRLLQRLLDWCEHDDDVRWLTVGCSLERGNADWMSDLDVAIGLREEHFEETLVRVRWALRDLGDLVESYDYLMPLSYPLRRFFAQYRDRTQVDLTVGFAPVVNLPRSVVLYDPEGAVHIVGDDGLYPKADEVRVWACQAWEALANVGKYVRRSSFFEALDQLDEARVYLFRLWALSEHVPQARFGLTALVDAGAKMPPAIDKSIAGPNQAEVLVAARHLAGILKDLQTVLTSHDRYDLPHEFAAFVAVDLARVTAHAPLEEHRPGATH
jgi:predicted nucleotidyltransferase